MRAYACGRRVWPAMRHAPADKNAPRCAVFGVACVLFDPEFHGYPHAKKIRCGLSNTPEAWEGFGRSKARKANDQRGLKVETEVPAEFTCS